MAGGLGVRKTYSVESRTGLITTGVFNAACAGVLIYSGVSELMAADFIYSEEFRDKDMKLLVLALYCSVWEQVLWLSLVNGLRFNVESWLLENTFFSLLFITVFFLHHY